MKFPPLGLALLPLQAALVLAAWSGCGTTSNHATGASHGTGTGGSTGTSTGTGGNTGGAPSAGTGLGGIAVAVGGCPDGGSTAISGTIYDPAGKNPLYGVVAYVPGSAVAPLQSGASCTSCSALYTGDPIAAAVTDPSGAFTIENAPDGTNIPLVIQVGKWRRQLTVPTVAKCANTPVADGMLTLPRNGSEGDLPQIAIATGGADSLECLLARIGVDKAEYTPGAGGAGHIHIFRGTEGPDTNPPSPDPSTSLWDSSADIMKYDIVLLSCEGHPTDKVNQQVLYDYASAGGRAFASHYHYAWFTSGPFAAHDLATWSMYGDLGDIQADVVTTFARGQAMHDWLAGPKVHALTNGKLPIAMAMHNADVTMANTASQPWLVVDGNPQQAQDFTFDMPFGVDAGAQCGRIAYSDMHVGAAAGDYKGTPPTYTPSACADADLSPQEKALEFILFDLSSCVTPNNTPIVPPGKRQ